MSKDADRTRSPAPPAKPIRVLIVDDHPLWRQTMRQVLEETGRIEIAGEAADGHDALALAEAQQPDVAVMDIDMPGIDGIEATRRMTQSSARIKVLVLSASDARADVMGAIGAGARGYLLKTGGAREIREAVARVFEGDVVLPPALAGYVVDTLRDERALGPSGDMAGLTDRELDVLRLMAEGHSNPAICSALFLSPKTIEGHISRIFTKLGLEPARDHHRRVLAVLRFLDARERGIAR